MSMLDCVLLPRCVRAMLATLLRLRLASAALLCCRPRSTDALRSSARRDRAARKSGLPAVAPGMAPAAADTLGSDGRAIDALRFADAAHDGGPSPGSMLSERLRDACMPAESAAPVPDMEADPRCGTSEEDAASGPFELIESCIAGGSLRLVEARALKGVGCGSIGPIWVLLSAWAESASAEAASALATGCSAAEPPASRRAATAALRSAGKVDALEGADADASVSPPLHADWHIRDWCWQQCRARKAIDNRSLTEMTLGRNRGRNQQGFERGWGGVQTCRRMQEQVFLSGATWRGLRLSHKRMALRHSALVSFVPVLSPRLQSKQSLIVSSLTYPNFLDLCSK